MSNTSSNAFPFEQTSWLAHHILNGHDELAWIDIREAGEYGEGHGLLAVNVPYSRLELDIERLVPRRATTIVVSGGGNEDALQAAVQLRRLGYEDVRILSGGHAAWNVDGLPVFQGVNVPSKAFAEFVELSFHTPDIEAKELEQLQASGADVVVLDSRTKEEFERFHVPGAISCPSSELVLHFADLVPSATTEVVISCAGRTRGVMGAQTLINAGVPNSVRALSGGTQGWKLAGFDLERDTPIESRQASENARRQAIDRETDVAARFGVPLIDSETAIDWRADTQRTTYFFDVRTPEEHKKSPLAGYTAVQGVQLVQCLDLWAAVRRARIVLADVDGGRAIITAHWLRQMGWDAVALRGVEGNRETTSTSSSSRTTLAQGVAVEEIDAVRAELLVEQGALLLDASSSAAYLREHARGAVWANRSALTELIPLLQNNRKVVVLAEEEGVAELLAFDLLRLSNDGNQVFVLTGGRQAWLRAGLAVETGSSIALKRIDYLYWLHDRHEGNVQASAAYLAWEADLPRAIGRPDAAGFELDVHQSKES